MGEDRSPHKICMLMQVSLSYHHQQQQWQQWQGMRERERGRKKDREGLHQSMQIHYFFVPLLSTRTTLPPWTKERVSKLKHVPLTHLAPRSSVWSLTMPILISNLRHRDPSWMRMDRKQNNTWFLKKLRNDMKGCFLKQSILRKKKKKNFKKYFASYIYQDLSSK